MNWILETYSDVYSTAMMAEPKGAHHVAPAKSPRNDKRHAFFGLFGRR